MLTEGGQIGSTSKGRETRKTPLGLDGDQRDGAEVPAALTGVVAKTGSTWRGF